MRLVLRQNSEQILTFSLQRGFRFVLLAIAAFIAVMLSMTQTVHDSNLGPILMIVFCVLCGGYYESWIFDKNQQQVEQRQGLFWLFKRKKIPMKDLRYIQVHSFIKGRIQEGKEKKIPEKKRFFLTQYHKLTLFTEEQSHDMEIVRKGDLEDLLEKAKHISQFCEIPLIRE